MGEQTLHYRTSDISVDGIMIETDRALLAGTQFRARVMLEEPPPLEVTCAVRQVMEGAGMGVAFTELVAGDQARVTEQRTLELKAGDAAELILVDLR